MNDPMEISLGLEPDPAPEERWLSRLWARYRWQLGWLTITSGLIFGAGQAYAWGDTKLDQVERDHQQLRVMKRQMRNAAWNSWRACDRSGDDLCRDPRAKVTSSEPDDGEE